jgi:hypothetical protein
MDDRPSPEFTEKLESEETVENERPGDGHDEIAGVGETEGDGDEARRRGVEDMDSISLYWSIAALNTS